MLISLAWISDYVDLPNDVDAADLAERFTRTTAEVEGVSRIEPVDGLLVAMVKEIAPVADAPHLHRCVLDLGGKSITTVSAAPILHEGDKVVFAPPGVRVPRLGEISKSQVSGIDSEGMILPADAIGIEMAPREAVFVGADYAPGAKIPAHLFGDSIIEVDNKSLTHRPDLWGHYGIAREIAAILRRPLKPYPVTDIEELHRPDLHEIPIEIADAKACRRYSGLLLAGVPTVHAPLWMQLRLGRTGLRPISGLVDLTNYIMSDLGQPMHAFDADKVERIEVDWAKADTTFRTLDGMERALTADDLMIKCQGRDIALAGVMGGLESEVSENTSTLLLESANFDPATIRRTASRLGLRTDASARFEKSLDPAHTVLGIQRFVYLARPIYPDMTLKSRLSDVHPAPAPPIHVTVNPHHVNRTIGRDVILAEAKQLLSPLGFEVAERDNQWRVDVPSYRATNDVSIEADVIEELARYIGYDAVVPEMPQVTIRRFTPNAMHDLERRTIDHFTAAHGFHEIHGYIWYDAAWLRQLGIDPGPCVELRNPAADGLHLFRRSLIPGMLAATAKNRFYFQAFNLLEVGSVFEVHEGGDREFKHVGLVLARRGKKAEDDLFAELKGAIESWAWRRFVRQACFSRANADDARPWEQPQRTAHIVIDGLEAGRMSTIDAALRRAMDEHLTAWSIAWAEVRLDDLARMEPMTERLSTIPPFPRVELDFSFLVPREKSYVEITRELEEFEHPLLEEIRYLASYEGKSVGENKRSLTFRTVIGEPSRTLVDEDSAGFRKAFESFLTGHGYELRA